MAFLFVDKDNSLVVQGAYEQRNLIADVGGRWDGIAKVWRIAFTVSNLDFLLEKVDGLTVSPDLEAQLHRQEETESKLARLRAMSKNDIPVRLRVAGLSGSMYNYQKLGVMYAMTNGSGVLLADEMGLGKENPVDMPVLSERGWVPIGSLVVGDRVRSRDGKLHSIVGVYPQGVKEIVRVTFSDGVTSECGWDHLWTVMDNNDAVRGLGWSVVTTRELSRSLWWSKKKVAKWRIPLVEPIDYSEKEFIVPPYLMGVLLGDGGLTGNGITFVPGDEEVPVWVENCLPKGYAVHKNADYGTSTRFSVVYDGRGNPMCDEVKKYGLKVTGEFKFIPDEYRHASITQRKQLLAGLLDTDGSAQGARTRFSTSSEKLADGVIDLVRGLGGMVVKSSIPGRLRHRNGRIVQEMDSWQLTIRTSFNPFLTPRNMLKWKKSSKLVRSVISIEPCRTAEAVCVSVDSPDATYVVRDYVVTHNTVQAICTALFLKERDLARNALIVTPASLKFNWPLEIEKFTKETYVVIDGDNPDERIAQWLRDDVFFYIVNYELLLEDLFGGRTFKEKKDETDEQRERRENRKSKAAIRQRILAPVRERVWDFMAVDEVHAIKHHSSRRTRNIKAMRAKFRMGLTGTPMDGRLEELHSVMEFIAPGLLGSKTRFFQRYIETDIWGTVTGYKRLGEVTQRIQPFFLRRLKREVLKDLPDKIYENRMVVLSPEEKKIYKALAERGHEATEDAEAMVAVIRCKQFCNWPAKVDATCLKSSKMDEFKEVVDEVILQNGHKVLIFSQYKEMLSVLAGVLEVMGVKYLRIDGDTPKTRRAEMQKEFNEDKSIDAMIGTEAMSTGLNFQAADFVLNYDDNWSPAVMQQREDRSHRLGQRNVVTVVNFVCRDTVEERIRSVIYGKSKLTSQVLGDETDELVLKRLGPLDMVKLL